MGQQECKIKQFVIGQGGTRVLLEGLGRQVPTLNADPTGDQQRYDVVIGTLGNPLLALGAGK